MIASIAIQGIRAHTLRAFLFLRTSWRTLLAGVLYAAAMVIVAPPAMHWAVRGAFYAYAALVFIVVWNASTRRTHAAVRMLTPGERAWFRGLLIVAVVALVVSRLLPFLRYGDAPLGYDTGFYLASMDGSLRGVLEGLGQRNFRALIWLPLDWLGIPKSVYLHGLFVLTQFLIAGTLYAFVRTIRIAPRAAYGATVLFLFAVSIPQFFAFWWMYYQTELAIALLLAALVFLNRRSWLVVFAVGFGVAIHPATFLPLTIALAMFLALQLLYSLIRLRPLDPDTRFLLLTTVIACLIAWPFLEQITKFVRIYLEATFTKYGWFLMNYPEHLRPLYSGLYVTPATVHLANVYILPFVVMTTVCLLFRRYVSISQATTRFLFVMVYGVVLLTMTSVGIIYANRYLVYLDLVLIAAAAPSVVAFIRNLRDDRAQFVMVVLLGVGLLFHGGYIVWKQEPHITHGERAELTNLVQFGEPGAYAMTTISHYTPWLLAFVGDRRIIDPGYGTVSRWDYGKWQEFWKGKSDARRHELLQFYENPIFIFMGKYALEDQSPYVRFITTDAHFTHVSPHIWRYDPASVTESEILAMRQLEAMQ